MTVAQLSAASSSATDNTIIEFAVPAHPNNSKAVVWVVVEGDGATFGTPPTGWVEEDAIYDAGNGVSVMTWTNDDLDADEILLEVEWTGVRDAAGLLVVSPDTREIEVGAAEFRSTFDDAGDVSTMTAEDDDIALIFGGTLDSLEGSNRYGDILSYSMPEISELFATLNESTIGIDAWVAVSSALSAGATGAVTYEVLGIADPVGGLATSVDFVDIDIAGDAAGVASDGVDLTIPATAAVGDMALVFAVGQPPNADANGANVSAPLSANIAAAWNPVLVVNGNGDYPAAGAWWRILTAADLATPDISIPPVGLSGELAAAVAVYRNVDPDDPFDTGVSADFGYATNWDTEAITTNSANAKEVVMVFATDHGDPSHADSLVTSIDHDAI